LQPSVFVLGQISLGEHLLSRMNELEFTYFRRRPRTRLLVCILSTRALIEPVRLTLAAPRSGSPYGPGQFFEPPVEWIIGGEVRHIDLVLTVGKPRDARDHIL